TTQPAPPPRKYRPELPRDLENVTLKCLEKEPGRRYGDCQALADDLRRWLEGEPVSARRPGVGERLARGARKDPAGAAPGAGGGGMVTFAVGAVVATVFGVEANEKAKQASRAAEREKEKAEDAEREAKRADRAAADAEREAKEAKRARDEADEKTKVAEMGRH